MVYEMETIFIVIFLILVLMIIVKTVNEENKKQVHKYMEKQAHKFVMDFDEHDFLKTNNYRQKIKEIHKFFNKFVRLLNTDEFRNNTDLIKETE